MFSIQLGHPKINKIPLKEFKHIRDVFLKLFHIDEECFYLFWNKIPIQFRYNQDLYENFDEILAIIWLISKEKKGESKIILTNQLMKINLQFYWKGDQLEIKADFKAFESLYQDYASELNKSNILNLSKTNFINEWNTLLHQVVISIKASNSIIKDGKEKRKLEILYNIDNQIKSYGRLYTK